jgi:uncharacterized protein YbjT (DUF2867 family)
VDRNVTVFGGTGFLGSRVVRHLLSQRLSVRIASRHPDRAPSPSAGATLDAIFADVNDERSVAAAVAGAYGVVNSVSLYVERGTETFHAVHGCLLQSSCLLTHKPMQLGTPRRVVFVADTHPKFLVLLRHHSQFVAQDAF